MRKLITCGVISSAVFLSGCSINDNPCEEIVEVNKQERMCMDLKKQMNNSKRPQIALTARKRYEEACVNFRYYRDEFDTICKGDEKTTTNRNEQQ
ncbi:MAG: hypothetical protein GJ680_03270 [Alteromonadaceae bacterium]|nr:hypothetical protein [Alteromonadaceae bacterium]